MTKASIIISLCISLFLCSCDTESTTDSPETVVENYDFTPENENSYLSKGNTFLMKGQLDQAVSLFSQMAENYPENKGSYLNSLGASYHMQEKYEEAIDTYVKAMQAGESTSSIDDNIWESCEYKYNKDKDTAIINKYLELFPEGKYEGKAHAILNK